ncbi:DUF6207 family protein [Streptomyces sp. NPDC056930]|uniref:DUF6207 family protein n=1 Tax=Streptomyces sp. NPDC056930 TaxID=3345967 RepID=UPI00363B0719
MVIAATSLKRRRRAAAGYACGIRGSGPARRTGAWRSGRWRHGDAVSPVGAKSAVPKGTRRAAARRYGHGTDPRTARQRAQSCHPRLTAADEATAYAVMAALELRWATSGIGPVRRHPGEPGVGTRVYADTRAPPIRMNPAAPISGVRAGGRSGSGGSGRPVPRPECLGDGVPLRPVHDVDTETRRRPPPAR